MYPATFRYSNEDFGTCRTPSLTEQAVPMSGLQARSSGEEGGGGGGGGPGTLTLLMQGDRVEKATVHHSAAAGQSTVGPTEHEQSCLYERWSRLSSQKRRVVECLLTVRDI